MSSWGEVGTILVISFFSFLMIWWGIRMPRTVMNFLVRSPRMTLFRERVRVLFDTPRRQSLVFLGFLGCSTAFFSWILLYYSAVLSFSLNSHWFPSWSGIWSDFLPGSLFRFLSWNTDFDYVIRQYRSQLVYAAVGLMTLVPGFILLLLRQTKKDALAAKLLANINNSSLTTRLPFVLFLRPFASTGQLQAPEIFSSPSILGLNTFELEDYLASALQNIGPLVALGKPGENVGAGRVYVAEEDWQDKFISLATTATVIILLPSNRAGTLWEINWLKDNGMLNKCICVMPPEKTGTRYWDKAWQEAATGLSKEGIILPEYMKRGSVFTLDMSGKVAEVHRVSFRFRRFFRKRVSQILQSMDIRKAKPISTIYTTDQLHNSPTVGRAFLQGPRPRSIAILSLCNLLFLVGFTALIVVFDPNPFSQWIKPLNQWLFILLSVAGNVECYRMQYRGLFLYGIGTFILGWYLVVYAIEYHIPLGIGLIVIFSMGLMLMVVGSLHYERLTRSF